MEGELDGFVFVDCGFEGEHGGGEGHGVGFCFLLLLLLFLVFSCGVFVVVVFGEWRIVGPGGSKNSGIVWFFHIF